MDKFNRIINPQDFDDPSFQKYIVQASGNPKYPRHRKYWEWGMGYKLLSELGYLDRGKVAIGLGTGYEPFAFILSNHLEKVIRTDYIDESNPFKDAYAEKINVRPGEYPPFLPKGISYDETRLEFINLDATDMRQLKDESVDIVYSFSSIEHFGNRRENPPHGAIRCMQESQRILKKKGICFGATEYQLTDGLHPEFFRHEDFIREIVESHSMQPVDEFDFSFPDELYNGKYYFSTYLRQAFGSKCKIPPHMGVISGNAIVVSVFFAFIKKR